MAKDNNSKNDHRHAGPADENHDRTGVDSLHGKKDVGTGNDSVSEEGGEESAAASKEGQNPSGDPDDPGREQWEEIARNLRPRNA